MVHRNEVRTLFLTYPQCTVTRERLLEHLQSVDTVVEYVIAQEVHADGGLHLHAYVKFQQGLRCSQFTPTLDVDNFHGNYQAARSFRSVIAYVKKDGNYITNLSEAMLETPESKRRKMAVAIETRPIAELIREGIIPFQSASAAMTAKSILQNAYDHDGVRGIWICGPPGTGKSHRARNNYPGPIYVKQQNKWWDGYVGEPTVLLDDFDCGKPLGHYLKIWADKWACKGEIKGGQVQLSYQRFIITSNYTIEYMFDGDRALIEAISRRFTVIEVTSREDTI